MNASAMPNHGKVLKSWLKLSMPRDLSNPYRQDEKIIVHSIVPFEPSRKRAHEDDDDDDDDDDE